MKILRASAGLLGVILLAACSDGPAAPRGQETVTLRVSANVTGTPVATMSIIVTASDMATPLIFNLVVVDGLAGGSVNVPPGAARTFTARAFDSTGQVTHEGSATIDVLRGNNPPLALVMLPRSGHVPVTVTVGSVSVVVSPASVMLERDSSWQLTATITDNTGHPVPGAVPTWASGNPAIASVDASGRITALAAGETQVVAVYAGVAGMSLITVWEGVLWVSVVTGVGHTCGLTADGEAFCWGGNNYGALGDSTFTDRVTPVAVKGGHTFQQLAASSFYTCGLTTAGQAYCWGYNTSGQLGNGTITNERAPVAVSGGHTFQHIAAGSGTACGVTTAGQAYCWGRNTFGQLGNGGTEDSLTPVAVSGSHTFASIGVYYNHACGVTATPLAYCWGAGDYGQLGDGLAESSTTPVAVSGGSMAQVSVGSLHTCGITASDEPFCWGANYYGMVGDGTILSRSSPVPVFGDYAFRQVAAGTYHTCGRTAAGTAYCWGSNEYGQLGDGTETQRTAPVEVSGGYAFQQLATAWGHTCGITVGGRAYCWGHNNYGQLGDGTTTSRTTPVLVLPPGTP
jgi:alpha-tubulin suppressor-like RCC1 family protein